MWIFFWVVFLIVLIAVIVSVSILLTTQKKKPPLLQDLTEPVTSLLQEEKEVFNLAPNIFTYPHARVACETLNARLASLEEIKDAYQKGANWCNYGWSEGQTAYYPTSLSAWNALQFTNHHKKDCGEPGVNGGYFEDPSLKFGVNCYGKKPHRTSSNQPPVQPGPSSSSSSSSSSIPIHQFNDTKWSEYSK